MARGNKSKMPGGWLAFDDRVGAGTFFEKVCVGSCVKLCKKMKNIRNGLNTASLNGHLNKLQGLWPVPLNRVCQRSEKSSALFFAIIGCWSYKVFVSGQYVVGGTVTYGWDKAWHWVAHFDSIMPSLFIVSYREWKPPVAAYLVITSMRINKIIDQRKW